MPHSPLLSPRARRLGSIFTALVFAVPLHAQNARPGSNARGTTGTTRAGGLGGTGGTAARSTGNVAGQYRRNTELGNAVITIDPETRSLVIVTDEDTHKELSNIIKNLDKPKPQVLIKVVFLEVTYNKGLDVGVEGSYTFNLKNPIAARTGTSTTTNATTGVIPGGTTATNGTVTTPLDTLANIGQTATLDSLYGLSTLTTGSFIRLASDDWTATIRALQSKGKVEILSRPSIMARNNQEAVIVVGSEVPFITSSSLTSEGQTNNTIRYDNVGIILRVTPFITSEGTVEMIVAPEISALTDQTVPIGNNTFAPVISKRSAETVVVTPHGRTAVIGGLMETQKVSSIQKVPILGDIPLLGMAFRRTITSDTKRELLIFLTPYIVNSGEGLEKSTVDEINRTELVERSFSQSELQKYLETLPATKLEGEIADPKAVRKKLPVKDDFFPTTPTPTRPRATPPTRPKGH